MNSPDTTQPTPTDAALIAQAEALLRDAEAKQAEESEQHSISGTEASTGESHLFAVAGAYGKYIAMFVGAGLISGSMVHFPLAPTRYLLIGACGAVLFTFASVISELRGKNSSSSQIARVILGSLALAVGIGMVSGGIQHFQDFPSRAAKLIPIGLGLSVTAFVIRNNYRMSSTHMTWLGAALTWILLFVTVGLNYVAGIAGGSSGDHSHGIEETPTTTVPVSTEITTPTAPKTASSNDHAGHGH